MKRLIVTLLVAFSVAVPAIHATAHSTPSPYQGDARPSASALLYQVQQRYPGGGGYRQPSPPPQPTYRPQQPLWQRPPTYQQPYRSPPTMGTPGRQFPGPGSTYGQQRQPLPARPPGPIITQPRLPLGGGPSSRTVMVPRPSLSIQQGSGLPAFRQFQALAQRQTALPQTALRSNTLAGPMRNASLLRPRMLAGTASIGLAAYALRPGSAGGSFLPAVRPAFAATARPDRLPAAAGCGVPARTDLEMPGMERFGGRFLPGSYQLAALGPYAISNMTDEFLPRAAQNETEVQIAAGECTSESGNGLKLTALFNPASRALTSSEISKGFMKRFTPDGRALFNIKGRIIAIRSAVFRPIGRLNLAPTHTAKISSSEQVRPAQIYRTLPMRPEYMGEHTPQGSKWGTTVQYLGDIERATYKLEFRNGRIYDSNGRLFDTTDSVRGNRSSRNAIFIMDQNGNLYASKYQKVGEFHHSSLAAGQPVAGAGELRVRNGVLQALSDRSGHYQPNRSVTQQVFSSLKDKGIDTSSVALNVEN